METINDLLESLLGFLVYPIGAQLIKNYSIDIIPLFLVRDDNIDAIFFETLTIERLFHCVFGSK